MELGIYMTIPQIILYVHATPVTVVSQKSLLMASVKTIGLAGSNAMVRVGQCMHVHYLYL